MVMEFLRGKTLLDIVEEDGRLEERDAVAYIVQIAEALDVIHGLKLLHRDIKPENIIITEEGLRRSRGLWDRPRVRGWKNPANDDHSHAWLRPT